MVPRQVDGQPVAVEVDGSHHYTNSIPQLPLSEVLIRRQLLQVRLAEAAVLLSVVGVHPWMWLALAVDNGKFSITSGRQKRTLALGSTGRELACLGLGDDDVCHAEVACCQLSLLHDSYHASIVPG